MEKSVLSNTCPPDECGVRTVGMPGRRVLELQAEVMRALCHPVRLQILLSLRDGERCVCEFEPILGLRQPNISQHLAILRGANLVVTRREGLRILYRLSDPDVLRVIDLVTRLVQRQGAELASVMSESTLRGERA